MKWDVYRFDAAKRRATRIGTVDGEHQPAAPRVWDAAHFRNSSRGLRPNPRVLYAVKDSCMYKPDLWEIENYLRALGHDKAADDVRDGAWPWEERSGSAQTARPAIDWTEPQNQVALAAMSRKNQRRERAETAWKPPPHANAESHAKVMSALNAMSPAELAASLPKTPEAVATQSERMLSEERHSRRPESSGEAGTSSTSMDNASPTRDEAIAWSRDDGSA